MGAVILYGLLIGLDNFQVASGLGMVGLSRRQKIQLAVLFGLFEGLMPLVGMLIGASLGTVLGESLGASAALVGPALLLLAGLVTIIGAIRGPGHAPRPGMLLVLPLVLSIDNLLAGAGLGALGYPVLATAAAVGLLSAGLSGLGLLLGSALRQRIPRADLIGGIALVMLALLSG